MPTEEISILIIISKLCNKSTLKLANLIKYSLNNCFKKTEEFKSKFHFSKIMAEK